MPAISSGNIPRISIGMHHTSRPQSCFLGLVVQHGVVPKLLPIVHERVRYDLLVGIPRHIVPIPIRYIIAVAEINGSQYAKQPVCFDKEYSVVVLHPDLTLFNIGFGGQRRRLRLKARYRDDPNRLIKHIHR